MRFDSKLQVIGAVLVLAGCAADGDDADSTAGDASAGTEADTGTAGEASASASMSGVTMSDSASAGETGEGSAEAGSEDTGPVEPQPNGSTCEENAECESGFCFVVQFLGGICGECLVDTDCPDGGCSLPNPISDPPKGAVCNDGGPGEGCMTTEVCQDGLLCGLILSVPGILEASTCGECLTDADCAEGLLCSPTYDVLNISGQKICVEPGSVVDGQGCDYEGTGDEACMSGICAAVNVMDLLMVGVCGTCEVDGDCTAPETCQPADVNTDTGEVTPPMCGMPK